MMSKLFLITICVLTSPFAHAWGERGHDLITRVAVQQLGLKSGFGKQFTEPFEQRDHMLSHISNSPDFHWRADYMSDIDRRLNSPTHWVSMETYLLDIEAKLPFGSYQDFASKAKSKGIDEPEWVGTAPWRILQFYNLMVKSLKEVKKANTREERITATNQALLYAGLMSHFVGDVANPHHTTTNHNGQLTGNTGLHAYFEGDVVRAFSLSLSQEIGEQANTPLAEQLGLESKEKGKSDAILNDPTLLISALIENSFANVDRLTELDNSVSLIEKSADDETDALRKTPESVAPHYKSFAVERMALGAAVLAKLWTMAWLAADQPDMADFQSYFYHISPDFVPPDYLVN